MLGQIGNEMKKIIIGISLIIFAILLIMNLNHSFTEEMFGENAIPIMGIFNILMFFCSFFGCGLIIDGANDRIMDDLCRVDLKK